MSDDPATQLRMLLMEKHGIRAAKITPEARIVQDLGVDGDDAAELLHDLKVRFGTDLSVLEDQWRDFFNTEGSSPRAILSSIVTTVICGVAAGALVAFLNWPKIIALPLVIGLVLAKWWLIGRWFRKELRPLTVAGLSEIVSAGRWPHDPTRVR